MMLNVNNSIELLNKIENENLYSKLIKQLNKDFQLSNIDAYFSEKTEAKVLQTELNEILYKLIQYNYDDYLNFLYRIDVSEKELLKIKNENILQIVEQIGFIILKREYQKVWLKQNFEKL